MKLPQGIVLCFLLVITCSKMSLMFIDDQKQTTLNKINCLNQRGLIDQIFIYTYYDSKSTYTSVDINLLNQQNISPHIIIALFFYELYSPDKSAARWASFLKNYKVSTVYVFPDIGNGYKLDCNKFWDFVLSLRKYLATDIGIFMDEEYWDPSQMLNFDTCYKLGMFALFYSSYSPFKPFGPWDYYSLKIGEQPANDCGVDEINEVIAG